MELRDENDIEVFINERAIDDGDDDDVEPVMMSATAKQRRRVSDIIDSMGDDENAFPIGFMSSRRYSNGSTDLLSPDQGYPATPVLSTSESANIFSPHRLVRTRDMLDANPCQLPDDYSLSNTLSKTGFVASMSVEIDADCYNMNHRNRGKCIVFNHETFDTGFSDRKGSSVDAEKIQQTFENLGFTVEIHNDLEHAKVIETLTQLSKEDHMESDCLCIFMLTHGVSHEMLCAKDAAYTADKLWKPFTADKCKTLAGKPKLFFIQACRGQELDNGVTLTRSPLFKTETDSTDSFYKIPTHADFLIAYSSVQGFYSWRNPTEGTWFVQSLCEVLDEYADRTDLLKMMTITARKIATTKASYHDVDPDKNDKKQVPSITSMLLRDVYFTPKQ